MNETVIYIHGKGGNAQEADHYRPLFSGSRVVGLEYTSETPWEAAAELPPLFDAARGDSTNVTLIANSIGAYFAMTSLREKKIAAAFFISPIVDMERLITDMMGWANVSEDELRDKGTVETNFGETLSWDYLTYVRAHPVRWTIPTRILYGEKDHLTSRETMTAFASRIGAPLTVMDGGEHWFHTPEQMAFLDHWITQR